MSQVPATLRFSTRATRLAATGVTALTLLLTTSSGADAKRDKGPAPACGITYIPFVEGTVWKYQYSIPPTNPDAPAEKPNVIKTRLPESLTIKVKRVAQEGSTTTITLEESYRVLAKEAVAEDKAAGIVASADVFQDTMHTTELSCTSGGLIVPPNSFFFVGELPGGLGMSIDNMKAKGEMYPGKAGFKKGAAYFVELKAEISRPPMGGVSAKHAKALLQMERQLIVGRKETVEVEQGEHQAIGVEFELSSQIALEASPDKEVFSNGKAILWFVPGIGVVRSYNRLGQGWDLASFTPSP